MLFLLVVCTMILESWAVSGQCDRSHSLKFSVSTWRNESGHRLVAAEVHSDESNDDGVSLIVDLFSEECGDNGTVILKTQSSSSGWSKEQTPVSTTVAPTVIPLPGYRHFPRLGYYKLLPKKMSWGDGVEACRKEGTHMLLVESQEEIETMFEWTGCCPWVGVHRENSSGPWINILGQKMNTTDFLGWLPGYPKGSSNCVLLEKSSVKGTSNFLCYHEEHIICEQTI